MGKEHLTEDRHLAGKGVSVGDGHLFCSTLTGTYRSCWLWLLGGSQPGFILLTSLSRGRILYSLKAFIVVE